MKIKTLLILTAAILSSSCRINGNFQGLYSYYEKTKRVKPNLLIIPDQEDNICNLTKGESAKIYVINGKSLKDCISSKKKALVYIWGPKCKSKVCYPLELLQQECDKNNIDLYVVSEYYDAELMEISYNIKNPIFGINTTYYNSNLTSKYLHSFLNDLTNQNETNFRYYYFIDGSFENSYETINFLNNSNNSKLNFNP